VQPTEVQAHGVFHEFVVRKKKKVRITRCNLLLNYLIILLDAIWSCFQSLEAENVTFILRQK